ncbi:MAG: hypothetical protein Ta2G_18870 [Termitinemataceae bacterium]|nr:MAG: hypothetical protein Ta2G_18870 [Termitinemataceae bacterium]
MLDNVPYITNYDVRYSLVTGIQEKNGIKHFRIFDGSIFNYDRNHLYSSVDILQIMEIYNFSSPKWLYGFAQDIHIERPIYVGLIEAD